MMRLRPNTAFRLDMQPDSNKTGEVPGNNTTSSKFTLDFVPEVSEPVICVSSQRDSQGAIYSGSLQLDVFETLEFSRLSVNAFMREKLLHPQIQDCEQCSTKTITIHNEELVDPDMGRVIMPGIHSYPLSFFIPGSLPATYLDKDRRIDYALGIFAETSSSQVGHLERSFIVARLCPTGLSSKRVRAKTNCFTADILVPPYVSLGEKFNVELALKAKDSHSTSNNALWEARYINWDIVEYVQDIRLPCQRHSETFRTQNQSTLQEHRSGIFRDELDLRREAKTPDELIIKSERFTLPCCIPQRASVDISTPNWYKVWHELRIRIYYLYAKPPSGAQDAKLDKNQFRTNLFGIGARISVCKQADSESRQQSWNEETTPPYPMIGFPPPSYSSET
ncbi:hypothetical protein TWF694_005479 [Orbilia ellipsospora]|uniref:LDB19 N-terminal domain-containing protein n=1 Tax=Orbilia ellipsospora TaxID=2528407 RepID=A0AAV9WT76_9PEZI